jgi:hypothetical protein
MTITTVRGSESGWLDAYQPTTVPGGGYIASGYFSTPQVNRTLIFWPTASLPTDADTWNSVTLILTVQTNFLGTSHTLAVYRLKRDWRSGGFSRASWDNYDQSGTQPWGTAGASNTSDRDAVAIGTSPSITSGTTATLSITLDPAAIKAWKSGSFANNGLILQASDESSTTLMRWEHTYGGNTALYPTLEIDHSAGGGGSAIAAIQQSHARRRRAS